MLTRRAAEERVPCSDNNIVKAESANKFVFINMHRNGAETV